MPYPLFGWFTEGFDTADLQEASRMVDYMFSLPEGFYNLNDPSGCLIRNAC